MGLTDKIFNTVFAGISATIAGLQQGHKDLAIQIKQAKEQLQTIKASFDAIPSFETIESKIERVKTDQSQFRIAQLEKNVAINSEIETLYKHVSGIKHDNKTDKDLIWTEIETIKAIQANELQALRSEVESLKQVKNEPTIESQPISEPEVIPVPKIKAKARTITTTQTKVKTINSFEGILPWDQFQSVLKRAVKITPKRGTIPVLNTVKIEFANNSVIVSATDLDNYYTAELQSNHCHSLSGKKMLIGRDQADQLSKARGMVVFSEGTDLNEPQSGNFTVKADNYKNYIYSLPPEDYPLYPVVSGNAAIVSTYSLIDTILNSRSAQSTDNAKSILTGTVIVRESFDRVSVASTDGYKLFVDELQTINSDNWENMILNSRLCEFLGQFKTHQNMSVFQTGDFIKIALDSGEFIYSRLISGKFPAFRKILPKKFNHTVTINRKQLLNAILDAKNYVDKETRVITINFTHDTATIKVNRVTEAIDQEATAKNHKKYSGIRRDPVAIYKKETVFCQDIECSLLESGSMPDTIGFNRSYLEAALKGFDSEKITICLNSEIQPVVISVNKYDERQTMIMPIKP